MLQGERIYRVDEYIFFVYLGGAEVIDANVSGLCISATELGEDVSSSPRKSKKVRWGYLRRSGSDAQREDAENQFYPILVDSLTKKIVKADKAIELGKDKNDYTPPDGLEAIWPIRDDKSEGRWQLSFDSVNKYLEYGYVKLGAASQANSYTLLYLPEGATQDFENGKIHQIGKDNFGGLLLEYVDSSLKAARPKTQWNSKSHSATDYGSSLILKFIPKRKFTNPKSLYAVEDTLRFFVADNPDAIILDFFAGSGTTAHAVMRLNRQDGGRRQSISITNNEVSDSEAKALTKQKYRQGDANWEKWGICDYITKPRIKAAITGTTPEGKAIEGDYKFTDEFPMAEGFEENAEFFDLTYETPLAIHHNLAFERIAPLLWMRAGSTGRRIKTEPAKGWDVADTYGLLTNLDKAKAFCEAISKNSDVRIAYIVTDDDRCFQSVAQDLPQDIEKIRLYESYLTNFQFAHGG